MALFSKSQFIDVIEWVDESKVILVYKWAREKDEIKQGAQLIVRPGQAAVWVYRGQLADIFYEGHYKLNTKNLPILSTLAAFPHGFNSPIKSDLYFVNLTQFIGQHWGTKNPIVMRDKDLNVVRVGAFGSYAFKINDVELFMRDVFGARRLELTYDIVQFLNSFVSEAVATCIGEMEIPVLDLARTYRQISEQMKQDINEKALKIGVEITEFAIENINLPESVEALIDEQSGIGMASKNMDAFMQYQTARAMRDASKQKGGLAGLGAGYAFGMGINKTVESNLSTPKKEESNIEKLREYKKLVEEGVLSQEECDALKKKLLGI